jgi:phosphoribosylglycinamide formyltransferase-1
MAGFMRVVGDDFTRRFRGRMLNIHPSLLPKYPGLKTHQRALEAGDAEHGATVHFVT